MWVMDLPVQMKKWSLFSVFHKGKTLQCNLCVQGLGLFCRKGSTSHGTSVLSCAKIMGSKSSLILKMVRLQLGICLWDAMGGGSTVRELLPLVYGKGLGSIPKGIDSHRAILGGQIDRTPEWDGLLPLNKTGLVRFVGPHSHSMGVCFSERVDRTPTVFWFLSEEIEEGNPPWYPFDQGLEWRTSLLDHCKQLMKNEPWHENLKKLVEDTPAEGVIAPWFLRTTQFPNSDQFPMVPTGRVTLLGDSAHAMPPDRGLGGNNVLEDARLLSMLLASSAKPIDWPRLTEKFEREMFVRARIAVQESNSAAEYFRSLRLSFMI